jgi:eukaryotic-like serine/threonine-protein kinase
MTDHSARSIFLNALEENSAESRARYIDDACANDVQLRGRVAALLDAHVEIGSLPPEPEAVATRGMPPAPEPPGTQIGPYKLREQIGEGGFGVVYVAQQSKPVRRKVALKIIKPGMDTRDVIARFEAERQALALMDHPNIAKVLDAGTTETGRPYFVMELVRGVPITEFCDDQKTSTRDRLRLFVDVCRAIQHAHQKGIIHRDLKPSNILVTLDDDRPIPKVIDFGISKALSQQLTENSAYTAYGQMIGTPLYMAPEQAQLTMRDVDTRSDVYSLGVLLYELLTGTTPFDKESLQTAGFDEMRRIIREVDPPRPSARISTLRAEMLSTVSGKRKIDPRKLSASLRGELDWIVMKALEKDRNRRYESASAFAADVGRYLADEPVQACPPSVWYRFRKFARRKKGSFAAAAVLSLALLVAVGAIAGSLGWMARSRDARQSRIAGQVDVILHEVERLEREQKWPEALAVARRAEALTADGADEATGERVRQALRALQFVAELEELRLREDVGAGRGRYADAGRPRLYAAAFRDFGVDVESLPAEQIAARLRVRPTITVALAAALDDWARAGRRQALDQSKRLWALASAVDPDPWRVSVREASVADDVKSLLKLANARDTARQSPQSQLLLASSLRRIGKPEQALSLLERACEMHPGDFWIHHTLAQLNANGLPPRFEAAIRHSFAARAIRPQSASTWNNLGNILRSQKRLDEAIAAYKKSAEIDPKSSFPHNNLGNVQMDKRDWDAAIRHYRQAITLDPNNATPHNNLGAALARQKKLHKAVAAFRKAIELDSKYALAYSNLGVVLHRQGKLNEAVASHRHAIKLDPKYAAAHNNLGLALVRQGKLHEGIASHRKAIELDPKVSNSHYGLGVALISAKKPREAVAAYRNAIALNPKAENAWFGLGNALRATKDSDGAVVAYRRGLELHPKNAAAHFRLGRLLLGQRKPGEAIPCLREAIALKPDRVDFHWMLGRALYDEGQFIEALAASKTAHALGSKTPGWKIPSARLVAQCLPLARLDARLPAILSGREKQNSVVEQFQVAWFLVLKRLPVAAARRYRDVLAANPTLYGHLYNAARAAALAGCGVGHDAAETDEAERAGWRDQALKWLRADNARIESLLRKLPSAKQRGMLWRIERSQRDQELAGVRDKPALARLPPIEREAWEKHWADVEAMRQRVNAGRRPLRQPRLQGTHGKQKP